MEDHLNKFVKDNENNPRQETNQELTTNNVQRVDFIADSEWINIPLTDLAYGKFYQDGTKLFIRTAKTKEIESFSIVNENNKYDVQLKINEILSACTKITFADGSAGSYRDIQDGDRDNVAIIIGKASAKNGRKLEKVAHCNCGHKEGTKLELIPANFEYLKEDPFITKYFNEKTKVYEFPHANGEIIKLAPPTIGLTQDINTYIFYVATKNEGKVTPNVTFMQLLPYLKAGQGVKSLTIEQLETEEFKFTKMNDEIFMFVEDAVNYLNFGVDKVKGKCVSCGLEVHTPFGFPNGARSVFFIPNAFKHFIR